MNAEMIYLVLLSVCSCLLWWRLLTKQPLTQKPNLHAGRETPLTSTLDVGGTFAVWLAAGFLGLWAGAWFIGADVASLDPAALSGQSLAILLLVSKSTVFIAVLGLCIYWWVRQGRSPLAPSDRGLMSDFGLGLIGALAVIPWILWIHLRVSQWVDYEHATLDSIRDDRSGSTILAAWISAVGIAPFVEEVLCRGVLQSWLLNPTTRLFSASPTSLAAPETRTKNLSGELSVSQRRIAAVVSAAFFALLHLGQGLALVPLFFFSLASACLYAQRRSIWPCVVLHICLNAQTMAWVTFEK